tara:strand:+ start:1883 stop:2278 length:396 start_codon:yes stop_codon:yes gene_type:complete
MLYEHWKEVPRNDSSWPWRFFKPSELACRGSGSLLVVPSFIDACERLRSLFASPLTCNSSYRSRRHNALIGGSSNSVHKLGLAADFSTRNIDRDLLLRLALEQGWTGIGKYNTFLHLDRRPQKRISTWGSW